MKQKYRWLFGALALIASASILFGCKPNIHPSSEAAKITVTVQEPKTFQVDKGSVWKTVKEKVKVTYTVGYELSNWKLGNKEGTALTDAHVFTENTTVYAVSKPKVTTVQYDRLKDYLNSPTDPPAADGVYYIEVTGLTNTNLESSSWNTPSPLGKILKDCGKKVALKLSGDITVIGKRAFYGCTELTSIIIPEEVTEISWAAFQNCTKLTEIHLPASLNKIEKNPFWGCENLTVITIAPTNRTYGCKDSIVYDKNEKKALFAAQGITGSITIPDGITAIGANAFSYRTKLTEIHLPASLNKIEGNPFSGCIHHTKLTVDAKNRKYKSENNMVYTSDMKTLVCAAGGLTNITIPNSVTAIGKGSFSGCTGLTAVAIGTDVIKIDKMAFYECLNLSNITIKSTVLTDIDSEAFKGIRDDAQFTVKTEAVKTLLHTQGYIAEDRITVNPSL